MKKAATIEEYLVDLPADQQTAINILRQQIKEAAPDVVEGISWGVPVFKVNGNYVAGIAAYKNHISFTAWGGWKGIVEEQELGDVEHTDTLLHFTLDNMIPDKLITKLIQAKIKQNELKTKKK